MGKLRQRIIWDDIPDFLCKDDPKHKGLQFSLVTRRFLLESSCRLLYRFDVCCFFVCAEGCPTFGEKLAKAGYHVGSSLVGTVRGKGIGPVSKIRNGGKEREKGKSKRCIFPQRDFGRKKGFFLSTLHAAFSLRFFLIFRDKWCYRLSGKHAFFTTFPPAQNRVFHLLLWSSSC